MNALVKITALVFINTNWKVLSKICLRTEHSTHTEVFLILSWLVAPGMSLIGSKAVWLEWGV